MEWRGGKGRAGQGRVPDCLGGLSRVGISSRSTRPWNGQPPSSLLNQAMHHVATHTVHCHLICTFAALAAKYSTVKSSIRPIASLCPSVNISLSTMYSKTVRGSRCSAHAEPGKSTGMHTFTIVKHSVNQHSVYQRACENTTH